MRSIKLKHCIILRNSVFVNFHIGDYHAADQTDGWRGDGGMDPPATLNRPLSAGGNALCRVQLYVRKFSQRN